MGSGKNVKWLPLDVDANDDPKIMDLESALGMEGYGTYIMLIQYLAKQEPEYILPLKQLKHLAYRHRISEEKILAVVNHFNLFIVENDCFYSASLQRRMERYDRVREINTKKGILSGIKRKALAQNNSLTISLNEKNEPRFNNSSTADEQRREEKSRIYKKRIKKSKEENTPSFTATAFIDNSNQLLVKKWYEWCDFRKALKKPYKTTTGAAAAYNKLLALADSNSDVAIAIMNQSIENEWLGLFPLKTNESKKKNAPSGIYIQEKEYKPVDKF